MAELRNQVQLRDLKIDLLENQVILEKSKKDSLLDSAIKTHEDLIREKKRNDLVTRDGIMLEQKVKILQQELDLLKLKYDLRYL